MSVIADLERRLKAAQHAERKAERAWQASADETARLRKEHDAAWRVLDELERAIAVLKRELKAVPTPPDRVVTFTGKGK